MCQKPKAKSSTSAATRKLIVPVKDIKTQKGEQGWKELSRLDHTAVNKAPLAIDGDSWFGW